MPKAKIKHDGLTDLWGRRNRKLEDKKCENCGNVFRPIDSKKRACSRKCGYAIRKLTPHNKGKRNGWIDYKGYKQIKIDGKSVREHRYLMEQFLGRKLMPNEDVHHVNGVKTDNRIENLQVISHSEHAKISNNRVYRKGYKLNLSKEERERRSESLKMVRLKFKIA